MIRILLVLTLACAGLPGKAQRVRVDYDHGCNFSHYRTYQWVKSQTAPLSDAQFPNQLMQERIVRFVEEELANKGFRRVNIGGDVLLSYDVRVVVLPQLNTFTDFSGTIWGWDGWWSGWGWPSSGCCGWGSSFSTTTLQTIRKNNLTVSMTDAHQNRLIFQGISSDELSSKPEKNTKRLQKGICEMFEKYPLGK